MVCKSPPPCGGGAQSQPFPPGAGAGLEDVHPRGNTLVVSQRKGISSVMTDPLDALVTSVNLIKNARCAEEGREGKRAKLRMSHVSLPASLVNSALSDPGPPARQRDRSPAVGTPGLSRPSEVIKVLF